MFPSCPPAIKLQNIQSTGRKGRERELGGEWMLAATEYSLTNRRSFGRADSTLSRASPVAQYQNSVPREREGGRGTTRVSINLTSNPRPHAAPYYKLNPRVLLSLNKISTQAWLETRRRGWRSIELTWSYFPPPPSLSMFYGTPREEKGLCIFGYVKI